MELKRGNIEAAEAEFALLKTRYDASVADQFGTQIELVYEQLFDGDMHSLPNEEIVFILTSSQDEIEKRYAAAALGNLAMWRTDPLQKSVIKGAHQEALKYIDRAIAGDETEKAAMIDLLYRLWQLAVPALLETLDADDADRVAFAGERLLYMKNEEIIIAIINKARATDDEEKKAQLVDILARMNEPCVPVMRFRECLDDVQAQELYERLVVPALEEFQASTP
jgi:hypothetical protein